MSEVKLVRLVSGEEVLAKIENMGEATSFDKPHIIIPTQAKGIALMPWCPYSNIQEDGVVVPNDKIMFITTPHDDLVKEYTTMVTGIEMSWQEIQATMERHGIRRISPKGEKFDYNFHQAMFEMPSADLAPGTVVEVVQHGYVLHDRLLRPAMVGVSKAAEPQENSEDGAEKT